MTIALIWIILGFALIFAEFALTSFVVIFFGISALLVGVLLWLGLPTDHGIPYLLFAGFSVALLLFVRSRFKEWFTGDTIAADADDDFLGREAQISSGFDSSSPGRGRVSYRGSHWDARSTAEQISPGSTARIVERDGSILIVEPLSNP